MTCDYARSLAGFNKQHNTQVQRGADRAIQRPGFFAILVVLDQTMGLMGHGVGNLNRMRIVDHKHIST